jgi:hypothetical protein
LLQCRSSKIRKGKMEICMDKTTNVGQWKNLVYFPTKLACSTHSMGNFARSWSRLISCSLICAFQPSRELIMKFQTSEIHWIIHWGWIGPTRWFCNLEIGVRKLLVFCSKLVKMIWWQTYGKRNVFQVFCLMPKFLFLMCWEKKE